MIIIVFVRVFDGFSNYCCCLISLSAHFSSLFFSVVDSSLSMVIIIKAPPTIKSHRPITGIFAFALASFSSICSTPTFYRDRGSSRRVDTSRFKNTPWLGPWPTLPHNRCSHSQRRFASAVASTGRSDSPAQLDMSFRVQVRPFSLSLIG